MSTPISPPITRETEIASYQIEGTTDTMRESGTVTAAVSVENVGVVHFVLWTGAAYDSIGQWTDADAHARVLELIRETYSSE
jgi:pyruvate/oxaloacetate carboxyltransferase